MRARWTRRRVAARWAFSGAPSRLRSGAEPAMGDDPAGADPVGRDPNGG